jgi:cell division protein FtsB
MQQRPVRRIGPEELNRAQIAGEIEALKAQRSELESQMAQLHGRRNRLDEQRHVAPSGAARAQIESQIAEIDARSSRLDMQILGLNDRITTAMGRLAEVPAGAERVVRIPSITVPDFQIAPGRRGPDMRQIAGVMAAEAVALALIGFVFWRLGMKRMRDQFERMFSSQTQQLSQLQQATDTIAVEVERISEAQRYVAKVLTEGSPATSQLGKPIPQTVRDR